MIFSRKKIPVFLFAIGFLFLFTACSNYNNGYKFPKKEEIRIALVLSGSLSDSPMNSNAYSGLKRFEDDYNCKISVVEKVSVEEAEKIFPKLVEKGFNLIISNDYKYNNLLKKLAKLYPEAFFCVIGGQIKQAPNLCSLNFKYEQYGYLIGIIAGLNTSTNKVGIIVGETNPSIEKIILGFRKGLKSVNPKSDLIVSDINDWNSISKGREAAVEQINTGVDVITHYADISGIGVIKAAEESDISAIGAVVDQHELAPTTVISSGLQDLSQLVYLACENYYNQTLEPSSYQFGLKDQVIDVTSGYGNIDPTTETRINRIKSKLIDLETVNQEENNSLNKQNL